MKLRIRITESGCSLGAFVPVAGGVTHLSTLVAGTAKDGGVTYDDLVGGFLDLGDALQQKQASASIAGRAG